MMSQPDRNEPKRWVLEHNPSGDWFVSRGPRPAESSPRETAEVVESREPFPSDEDGWDYEDFVQTIREQLAKGSYMTPGELLPYEDKARAIAAVIAKRFPRAVLDAVSSHRDEEAREVHRDDAACTCVIHEGADPECYYHGSPEKRTYARAVSDVVEELQRFPELLQSRMAVAEHIEKWAADRKAGT